MRRVEDPRTGLVSRGPLPLAEARRAIVRSLATSAHAAAFYDALLASLGERGWSDPDGGAARRRVFLRDPERPEWLVPVALAEIGEIGTRGEMIAPLRRTDGGEDPPLEPPEHLAPPQGVVTLRPRNPRLFAGDVQVTEGGTYFRIDYDAAGRMRETSAAGGDVVSAAGYEDERPPTVDPLARPPTLPPSSLLTFPDLTPEGFAPEALAHRTAKLDLGARVGARVRMPVPLPGGPDLVLRVGVGGLRRALLAGDVPAGARWAVVDGFEGKAMATDETPEAALQAWQAAVWRARPAPPSPRPPAASPPEPPVVEPEQPPVKPGERRYSTGLITIQGPQSALSWPAPSPEVVPAVLFPLAPAPASIPPALAAAGYDRYLPLVGRFGEICHVLRRVDPEGFTLIGAGVLDLVDDPAALDAELDRADARAQEIGIWRDMSSYPEYLVRYVVWDDLKRARQPARYIGRGAGGDLLAGADGDSLAWQVARARPTRAS